MAGRAMQQQKDMQAAQAEFDQMKATALAS
jgi:hypothetical protein